MEDLGEFLRVNAMGHIEDLLANLAVPENWTSSYETALEILRVSQIDVSTSLYPPDAEYPETYHRIAVGAPVKYSAKAAEGPVTAVLKHVFGLYLAEDKVSDVQIAPLRYSRLSKENPIATTGIEDMLSNLGHALKYWTWENKSPAPKGTPRKWYIEHEYHFQNLVWTVLASRYVDIRPEISVDASTEQDAVIDFVIPSLDLAIELKYWRGKHRQAQIIKEIAQDAGLYLGRLDSRKNFLVLVWDDGRRSEEHASLLRNLREIPGVTCAIVVSRPGKLEEIEREPESDDGVENA